MSTHLIAEYLKAANLQMAAEAFLQDAVNNDANFAAALIEGNRHTNVTPRALAEQLAAEYRVLAHRDNTHTGFSGTLFRNKTTGELTLSFRSTEFVDDSLRDQKATGDLEIRRLGWAVGQIADMEKFYAELKADANLLGSDKPFYVTGYSLGGHLATAFNLLRQDAGDAARIIHTYTFNGAGVGGLAQQGDLTRILTDFNKWQADPASIPWQGFSPGDRALIEQQARDRPISATS